MATTAVMLTDEQLITSSRVILLGDVQSVSANWDPEHSNIYTYVRVRVSRLYKGQVYGSQVVLKQLGGVVENYGAAFAGAPEFRPGQTVLLFLDTAPDGALRVAHVFMGKYDVTTDKPTGQVQIDRKIDRKSIILLGKQTDPGITNNGRLSTFERKIKRTLRERAAEVQAYEQKYARTQIVEIPREYIDRPDAGGGEVSPQYTFYNNSRWFEPDSGSPIVYLVNPANPPISTAIEKVNEGMRAWTNINNTTVSLQNGGSTTSYGLIQDGVTAISFNDPRGQLTDLVNCSGGALAGTLTYYDTNQTTTVGGMTFYKTTEADVVFNNGIDCQSNFAQTLSQVACHELGHTLGFNHSDDLSAILWPQAPPFGLAARLGSDDIQAVTFLYPVTPASGYSLSCNGSSAYASVPNSSSLNITGPITVEAWIKIPTAPTASQGIVERYDDTTGATGGYALRLLSNSKVKFYTLVNGFSFDAITSNATISTNVWHHVAGQYDGSTLRVYVDGQLSGSKSSTFAPGTGNTALYIGKTATGSNYFNGLIDEVRVTAAAVYPGTPDFWSYFIAQAHHKSLISTQGLWKFDGQSVADTSGNGNTGSVSGATYSTTVPGSSANYYALLLNGGTNSNFYTPVDSSSLDITGSVTVEAWIKIPATPAAAQGIVERYDDVTGEGGYALRLLSTGKIKFFTLVDGFNFDSIASSATISANTWHHVAGVFDGSSLKVFVDGQLSASKSSTFAPGAGSRPLAVGQLGPGGGLFVGLIDEVRVTASAVYSSNFTPQAHLQSLTNTRVLFNFDGPSARDLSGNHNDALAGREGTYFIDTPQ